MKFALFLIGSIFFISSCDMQVPTVPEYKKGDSEQPKMESEPVTKPVITKPTQARPPIKRKINKQDSSKLFETKNLPITRGTPKRPTPPEDILDK
ncbi:MAG: hypothetical protein HN553_01540 [Opitutae bacterium]|jgi:hypothetical protein|nr:hypothetical protein [Opitutae bacterium]